MQRLHQFVFMISVLMLSWLGMMIVHELGHVVGAVVTGGTVGRVVLHPMTISRTEILPNPNPLIVVWLGPLTGCLLPIGIWSMLPTRLVVVRQVALFFAGFCLLANGCYILFGSVDGVGDCGVMMQHGSPFWTLIAFGGVSIPSGIVAWHRLGSVKTFLRNPGLIDPVVAWSLLAILMLLTAVEMWLSPL